MIRILNYIRDKQSITVGHPVTTSRRLNIYSRRVDIRSNFFFLFLFFNLILSRGNIRIMRCIQRRIIAPDWILLQISTSYEERITFYPVLLDLLCDLQPKLIPRYADVDFSDALSNEPLKKEKGNDRTRERKEYGKHESWVKWNFPANDFVTEFHSACWGERPLKAEEQTGTRCK